MNAKTVKAYTEKPEKATVEAFAAKFRSEGFDLNLTEAEASSLTKANKSALEKILKALADSKSV